MTSEPHECAVQLFRDIFIARMKGLQSQHGGCWRYGTNSRFHIHGTDGYRVLPTTSSRTPDGSISDKSGLLFLLEVSRSESRQAVHRKLKEFFNSRSVIAAIVVNIDETPPFAKPNANEWDSAEELVELSGWENVGCDAWKPIMFAGHCWAGKFGCQIELHWSPAVGDEIFMVVSLTISICLIDTDILTVCCSLSVQ
jgi:hypothetical protein